MNEVFRADHFWRLYFALESDDISEHVVASQLDAIAKSLPVRSDIVTFEHAGRPCNTTIRVAEFRFPLTGRSSLLVEYQPALDGGCINLVLESELDVKHTMGWWDLARWHPYCLRMEELDLLLRFWQVNSPAWSDPSAPLLLLAPFVGVSDRDAHDALIRRVHAAYSTLCPDSAAPLAHPPIQLSPDYRWEQDPELGWVYTSAEYACYSIRNRAHTCGTEGVFPFQAWSRQTDAVRESLD